MQNQALFVARPSQKGHGSVPHVTHKLLCMYVYKDLRWFERVFNCYNPFETMKDYKELFQTM